MLNTLFWLVSGRLSLKRWIRTVNIRLFLFHHQWKYFVKINKIFLSKSQKGHFKSIKSQRYFVFILSTDNYVISEIMYSEPLIIVIFVIFFIWHNERLTNNIQSCWTVQKGHYIMFILKALKWIWHHLINRHTSFFFSGTITFNLEICIKHNVEQECNFTANLMYFSDLM